MQFVKWMSLVFIRYLEDNMEGYDKKHWTMEGFNKDGSKTYKAKCAFDNELKAQQKCFELNLRSDTIHKLVVYKCPICHAWHIGHHNNKIIDNKEKQKISQQYNKWKIIHNIR